MHIATDRSLAAALGVAAVAGACATATVSGTATQNRMWAHFDAAARVQAAIVQGHLQGARSPAEAIWAVESVPGLGPEADPYIRVVREHARQIRDASTYGQAAQATGRLAAACGACHQALGGGPRLQYRLEDVPAGAGLDRHATRHAWAADRLWEGLLGPSDDGWQLGARLLAEDPLASANLSSIGAGHAARLNALGREALEVVDPAQRGDVYGRILSTCGACHAEEPGER
jgi:hypothetical protein